MSHFARAQLDSLAERIAVSPIGEELRKAIKASLFQPSDYEEFVQKWAFNCYEYAAALIAEGERRASLRLMAALEDELKRDSR